VGGGRESRPALVRGLNFDLSFVGVKTRIQPEWYSETDMRAVHQYREIQILTTGFTGYRQGYTRSTRAIPGTAFAFPTSTALPSLYPRDMIQRVTLVTGTQVLVSGAFIFATWSAWKLFIKSWFSPLRRVPGPGSKSFIWGNILEVNRAGDISKVWEGWFAEFGHVFVAKGFFNVRSTLAPQGAHSKTVTSWFIDGQGHHN